MKKRILLIDDSLTVQKVVSLTLDKNQYELLFARSRSEVIKMVVENPPDLILLSDQVSDLSWQSFPKEIEAWLGRATLRVPQCVLITSQDIPTPKHFAGIIKKPFTPHALQAVVASKFSTDTPPAPRWEEPQARSASYEDDRMHKVFNEAFADETKLTQETLRMQVEEEEPTMLIDKTHLRNPSSANSPLESLWEEPKRPQNPAPRAGQRESVGELWGGSPGTGMSAATQGHTESAGLMGAEDSMAYKAVLENQVQQKLSSQNLNDLVEQILSRMLPPIVERLVQERLDKLLRDQENSVGM